MEIHVKDNAINSLEIGLVFYNKFLDNLDNIDISVSHFGNLKFTVMAIHNSVELLTKAILLDINEFLVFKTEVENDDILCKLLREQYYNKKRNAHIAYHAVFSRNSYKTIDYGKCIMLLQKIFYEEISKSNYETLKDLSDYRNALTHLGYASTLEWYKILIVLNKSLDLIPKFYIKNMINSEEYFNKEVINNIEATMEKSKRYIYDVWMASNEHILEAINEKIDLYIDDRLVKIDNIEEDSEYGFYRKVDFTYNDKDKDINIVWKFMYSYVNESIIIVDSNNMIVGYISIEDWNLLFSYDGNELPEELKETYILVPKETLYYDKEKIYDISSKTKNIKLKLESVQFLILINLYLSKQNSN